MSVATFEQVVVGKLSAKHEQIAFATLSQDFVWLKHLSVEELAEFFSELLGVLSQSRQSGDWSAVVAVLEAWQETAQIKADPIVTAGIQQGLAELAAGQGVSWTELQAELNRE